MIHILTFKPVLIGCQYGLFVVYGAFYLVKQLTFHCFYKRIAECLGRNFRPDLSGVLCREGITPVVILILADFAVLQLLSLVSPCRKHLKHRLVHSALTAVKHDMHFIPLLFSSYTMKIFNRKESIRPPQAGILLP